MGKRIYTFEQIGEVPDEEYDGEARLSRLGQFVPMRLAPELCLSCAWSELASLLA